MPGQVAGVARCGAQIIQSGGEENLEAGIAPHGQRQGLAGAALELAVPQAVDAVGQALAPALHLDVHLLAQQGEAGLIGGGILPHGRVVGNRIGVGNIGQVWPGVAAVVVAYHQMLVLQQQLHVLPGVQIHPVLFQIIGAQAGEPGHTVQKSGLPLTRQIVPQIVGGHVFPGHELIGLRDKLPQSRLALRMVVPVGGRQGGQVQRGLGEGGVFIEVGAQQQDAADRDAQGVLVVRAAAQQLRGQQGGPAGAIALPSQDDRAVAPVVAGEPPVHEHGQLTDIPIGAVELLLGVLVKQAAQSGAHHVHDHQVAEIQKAVRVVLQLEGRDSGQVDLVIQLYPAGADEAQVQPKTGGAGAAVVGEENRPPCGVGHIAAEIGVGVDSGDRLTLLVIKEVVLADRVIGDILPVELQHVVGFIPGFFPALLKMNVHSEIPFPLFKVIGQKFTIFSIIRKSAVDKKMLKRTAIFSLAGSLALRLTLTGAASIIDPQQGMEKFQRGGCEMENQEIVCYCSNVTKGQIIEAMDNGARTLADIRKMTGACTKGRCKELSPRGKCCSPVIMEVIGEYLDSHKQQ